MKFDLLKEKRKIVMLTAYDYQMAKILDETGIDLILVGDSLGMVVLGYGDTKKVTIEDMIYHTKAVARGAKNTPIVGDMPINSCNTVEDALKNANRFLEAGAQGVKIEGNKPEVIKALLDKGIPIMGHVGLLPQTAERYRLKGKDKAEGEKILKDAMELDQFGVFTIVLECIPESLAKKITESIEAPTIGIGAGRYCDGQVLVINDMLGFDEDFSPKYLKRYTYLGREIKKAIVKFKEEVLNETYPDGEHTYH
ncbi:MAG: 3-methyl-2-oxobutanoate hydroxymethyltransferase [Candidatus Bathyarchaeota archaeon]|nr:MAG: 3-methyl-2-oxobutanoate hydroxymethyltransferase [Candidatus Bathyarchaeota archaeon]